MRWHGPSRLSPHPPRSSRPKPRFKPSRTAAGTTIAAAASLPWSGRTPPSVCSLSWVFRSNPRARRKTRCCAQATSPDTIPPAPLLAADPFAKS
jgi:hypothetical protein